MHLRARTDTRLERIQQRSAFRKCSLAAIVVSLVEPVQRSGSQHLYHRLYQIRWPGYPMISFSRHFEAPEGSPIRALFPYLNDPAVIGFAGGNPAPDVFDVDGLREAMSEAMGLPAATWAQYSATEGIPALREALAIHMSAGGYTYDAQSLLVTASSQQGFDLLTRVLLDPGDVVAVERPTYTTALQALRLCGARTEGVESDEAGLDTSALERMLAEREGRADRVKAVYVVPTFANPSGATLSLARRKHLVELAVRYQFVVVEDDPYADLRFEGERLPRIIELARDVPGAEQSVVYLSSLSKIMAPGARIGWLVGHPEILRRCVIAKQSSDLCSATWTQAAAAIYIAQGRLPGHIARARDIYAERARAMCDALRSAAGDDFLFSAPKGGMFVWGRFAADIDANALLTSAIQAGVVFVPGAPFFAGRPDVRTARLCFTMCAPERIRTGVERLVQALEQYRRTPVNARRPHL
jgi:2-aminoadipate transaminase